MGKLIEDQIEAINKKCPYNQGVFKEPFGIPNHIKEPVIYTRWESGGLGGSCWDDENTVNEPYERSRPANAYEVLGLVLEIVKPDVTFLQMRKIVWNDNTKTDYGYYGDYTEETIEWIVLSDLYKELGI